MSIPATYTCPCCFPDTVQMVLRDAPRQVVFDCPKCGCAIDATPADEALIADIQHRAENYVPGAMPETAGNY